MPDDGLINHRIGENEKSLGKLQGVVESERVARQEMSEAYAGMVVELKNVVTLTNQNAGRYDKMVWWILGLFALATGALASSIFL